MGQSACPTSKYYWTGDQKWLGIILLGDSYYIDIQDEITQWLWDKDKDFVFGEDTDFSANNSFSPL